MWTFFKKAYWNHGLILVFLLFNIIPIYTVLTIKVSYWDYDSDTSLAILYILLGLLMTVIGYIPKPRKLNKIVFVNLGKKYKRVSYILCFIGAYVAYRTLTEVSDFSTLQHMIMQGEEVKELKWEMGAGGLGGIVKMFACLPLCVFLMTSALYFFRHTV